MPVLVRVLCLCLTILVGCGTRSVGTPCGDATCAPGTYCSDASLSVCAVGCADASHCASGETCADGTCVAGGGEDTATCSCDGMTCGFDACGNSCGTCTASDVCNAGTCEPEACPTGAYQCADGCSNLVTDVRNCGSCGYDCGTATYGTVSCENADCVIECDSTAMYCGGDDCSPCPTAGVASTTCSGGACVVSTCEDGFSECDGTCQALTPGATQYECTDGQLVATWCEGGYLLDGSGQCVCPTVVEPNGEATYALPLEADVQAGPRCNATGPLDVASSQICAGDGEFLFRLRGARDGFQEWGFFSLDECGDYPLNSHCEDRWMSEDEWLTRMQYIHISECMIFEAAYTPGVAQGPIPVDVYGPLTSASERVVSVSNGRLSLPANVYFNTIQLRRNTSATYQEMVTITETLASGEARTHTIFFNNYGRETRTLDLGWVSPDSTVTFSALSTGQIYEATLTNVMVPTN